MSMTPDIQSKIETLEAFGAVLRKRREEKGLSLEALGKLTGISKPYLANIETARTPGPPTEGKLRILEKALGFGVEELVAAADWLRTPASVRALLGRLSEATAKLEKQTPRRADGAIDLDAVVRGKEGEKQEARSKKEEAGTLGRVGEVGLKMVPVINRVAAGAAAEHGDLEYPAGVADMYVPGPTGLEAEGAEGGSAEERAAWKSAFAARITGDSMAPKYVEGDVVIVAPMEAHDGEDCLVRLGPGENYATTIKRIYFVPDHSGQAEAVRLVPRNAAHAERVVALSDVTGIYPVVYRMTRVRGRA